MSWDSCGFNVRSLELPTVMGLEVKVFPSSFDLDDLKWTERLSRYWFCIKLYFLDYSNSVFLISILLQVCIQMAFFCNSSLSFK